MHNSSASTSIRTICCYCGTGCGIEVKRDARGALSLIGDAQHPTNRGMLCAKGKTLLHAALARDERLLQPQLRLDRNQPLGRVTWDAALSHVASAFKRIQAEHGPDAVGFYCSGQMLTEEYYVINKLVKGFLRTNNLDTNSRLCMSSAVAGYKRTLGVDSPPIAYDDIESCDTFLVTGANPAWAHPILWRRVEARKAVDANVRIIVIDPRRTATCIGADLHLQIQPGSDVAMHLGLARRLHEIGGIDTAFIRDHCQGWQELRQAMEPYTLAEVERICRVQAADVAQAAEWLAGDRRFLSLWTMGLNQSAMGVDKNVSLINLSLITGKIGKPGCGPFSLTGQPNAMGGREVGGMATLASAHRDLDDPVHRREIAAHWRVDDVPAKPGLTAVEMFRALKDGRMKAVWIVATNPVESLPDAWAVEAALAAAELVVVQDIFPTATTAFAHVLLPAATWLEKRGTMTNSERRVSLLDAAIEPPGACLPDSRIICRFAAHMGWGDAFAYDNEGDIFAEHAALSRGRDCDISGLSHARLARGSAQWPVPDNAHPGTPRLFVDGVFPTAGGRARLQAPVVSDRSEPLSAAHPLILTTGRLRDQWHTMTRTGRVAKLRAHAPEPFCEINPADAAARGIVEGDVVEIANERGAVQVLATVTDQIKSGVVFLPMHWGKRLSGERGRTNNLCSSRLDPVSFEPDLKFAAVEVRRHVPPRRKLVIVGAGAAARALVEAHRAHGSEDEILIFGDEEQPIYNRVMLPHLISRQDSFANMITATAAQMDEKKVILYSGSRIARIDRAAKAIIASDGTRHDYDLLVLATGSRAAKHFQGALPKTGVYSLRKRADAELIRAQAGRGRRAIVVGGGVLGLELADALRRLGASVTILQRGERLMSRQLDAKAAQYLAQSMTALGIEIRFSADVEEVRGTTAVTGVTLKGGVQLGCDLLIFATGTVPNAELARSAVLECSTGVIVDQHMRTSDPAIHAIGEVAEYRGREHHGQGHLGLAAGTTAAVEEQARHLAEYLRGNLHARYRGPVNANILKVDGIQLATIGVVEADAGMSEIILDDPALGIYQKCVIKDDRLIGVIMFGDTALFPEYRDLVSSGSELDDKRRWLLRPTGEAKPVDGKLVCSCNQIGEGTITAAIDLLRPSGGCTLSAVSARSRAGTSCGSCRPEVARLLEQRAEVDVPPPTTVSRCA